MSQAPVSAGAVLVIAGTDSSGGAGLTRDIQVLTHFGVQPLIAVTAVTAQSDARVTAVHPVPPSVVRAQIEAAFANHTVAAIKVGMLATSAIVEAVAASLPPRSPPLVLDPVLFASSGGTLLDEAGTYTLRDRLFPRVTLLTPNIPEAAALLGEPVARGPQDLIRQARRLQALGPRAVLVKGGHGEGPEAIDYLLEATFLHEIASERLDVSARGTGCTLASAAAAGLATGLPMEAACLGAKDHVMRYLRGQP